MGQATIINTFNIDIQQEAVLNQIGCYEESSIYSEIVEEYHELMPQAMGLIEPYGIFEVVDKNGTLGQEWAERSLIYVTLTVGNKISEYVSQLFIEGDYLKAMLADALADRYLFSMEKAMEEPIRIACERRHQGIERRLEAPNDLPLEVQKVVWDVLQLKERLNIDLSRGYMFNPVKTTAYFLVLSEDAKRFNIQHDCSKCPAIKCKFRQTKAVEIEVLEGHSSRSIACQIGDNLLEALKKHDIFKSAVCGGKGICGKCKVQLVKGDLPITLEDREKLSEEELESGYRLACRAVIEESLSLQLLNEEAGFEVLTHYKVESPSLRGNKGEEALTPPAYILAIDIGTTTLVVGLVEEKTGKLVETTSRVNKQRAYGADVISRIQASNEGKGKALQENIKQDLLVSMRQVFENSKILPKYVKAIIIGGNTTMGHLLMGYSCETLGVYPFTPVTIDTIKMPFKELFNTEDLDCQVVLLPGISTYVGGDITAGLLACHFEEREEVALFVDIGTNGEMAIGTKEEILCAATAAGPAFEGGNILWGVGSIRGAISHAELREDGLHYETIGGEPPVGLCGTGVIEIVAELVREEIIDETGLLEEAYLEQGYPIAETLEGRKIVLTQKDIREIQLAKSAIRTGIEILLRRYGTTYEQVEKVYLAGGFGFNLDQEKAITIGLFPEAFRGKIEVVGNTSLGGAIYYGTHTEAHEVTTALCQVAQEINLSTDKHFSDFYMEYMLF